MNLFCWHKHYHRWLTLQFTVLKDERKEFGSISKAQYVELYNLNQETHSLEYVGAILSPIDTYFLL